MAVVDDLVLVPGPQVGGRAGPDRVLDAVDQDLSPALEEKQQLLLGAVLVLADVAAGRDPWMPEEKPWILGESRLETRTSA